MAICRSPVLSPISLFLPRGGGCNPYFYLLAILSIFSLLLFASADSPPSHFDGFDADDINDDEELLTLSSNLPLRSPPPPTILCTEDPIESHHDPPSIIHSPSSSFSTSPEDSSPLNLESEAFDSSSIEEWDEDEFEGFPQDLPSHDTEFTSSNADPASDPKSEPEFKTEATEEEIVNVFLSLKRYTVEILCGIFLIVFLVNYLRGKKKNENIALAWVTKFASKGTVLDKNFSLLGMGETEDLPLLLKERQNVFKIFATGRRFCQGMLVTMELKSRHDLISRLYNVVVGSKDEITFEVYMNDDAMDQVILYVGRKKLAKTMQKEVWDLQKFASLVAQPSGKKWLVDDLAVVSESKEVAGDMITEAVLDQVFGDKAFQTFGKDFISMHFSDQRSGSHKKMLVFKFALPELRNMGDMSRLVALVPYYIDLVGRYKLSSNARSRTEAARLKVAQEMQKERLSARQEALQKKKAEQRKKFEEAEAKLSAEALLKKEERERARQLKKAMPKLKVAR